MQAPRKRRRKRKRGKEAFLLFSKKIDPAAVAKPHLGFPSVSTYPLSSPLACTPLSHPSRHSKTQTTPKQGDSAPRRFLLLLQTPSAAPRLRSLAPYEGRRAPRPLPLGPPELRRGRLASRLLFPALAPAAAADSAWTTTTESTTTTTRETFPRAPGRPRPWPSLPATLPPPPRSPPPRARASASSAGASAGSTRP